MREDLNSLLGQLSPALDPATARFVASDLRAGEEAMALNLLVTALTADGIPVTTAQRGLIRSAILFFDLNEEQRGVHPALADVDDAVRQLTISDR